MSISSGCKIYRIQLINCNVHNFLPTSLQEGEVSTVEVTRRMSEERDLQPHTGIANNNNNNNHGMAVSNEDKERRLQRWKDKLGPRDETETAVMTASGASAIKVRRDRPSRTNEAEPPVKSPKHTKLNVCLRVRISYQPCVLECRNPDLNTCRYICCTCKKEEMITWRGPLKRSLAYCSYDRVTIIIILLRAKTFFLLLFKKKRKMRDRYLLNTSYTI